MYGAVIGDLAGSIYEYDQLKGIKKIDMDYLIEDNSFYSDDTILTMATLDAVLHNKHYSYYLKKYIKEYINYKPNFTPYFKNSFSPNIIKWSKGDYYGRSYGNGALMKISPIGYMFDNEKDVKENAIAATIPSHNSKEAIIHATKLALIIYYLRKGMYKEKILDILDLDLEYKPFKKFNTGCEETFNNCIHAFYNSYNFEDAIRKTLLMGGDTDTNCAIVGSMAEAAYGIKDNVIEKANEKLPEEFVRLLSKARK